ncbi:MAG: DUF2306 domain-containing protein [Saprospiraceae bacterium]|nr:DUF2306 domain-containing protein [Saprospiraceae bacterium]
MVAIFFFTWLMARIVWPYRTGRLDIDFLLSKQHIIYSLHYRFAFYLHIFPALLVLSAGLTQFSDRILRYRPIVHRLVGSVYTHSILWICGPAGFLMAWYSNGGWIARSSFLTLSVGWWAFTWLAWRAIKNGQRNKHRDWMIRSYALTLSAVSLRLMQFVLATNTQLDVDIAYQIVAWPSWVINLLVAECILFYKKTNGTTQP